MHNRMHDWSYNLGFTETAWNMQRDNGTRGGKAGDPELGYSQSGAQSGSRNNANQGTPPDGISGYSNMYLWQPLAGRFYAPCVDGDYDMSVIGHEYGHAISNRMAGGPDAGLSGLQDLHGDRTEQGADGRHPHREGQPAARPAGQDARQPRQHCCRRHHLRRR
ncbi:M36 family metallopeptidase [Janibacter hoylei]|uniref:M36 family metallopeptidase n=1 Tax=Janibacter hoylei TaxID=364298 RepID=UPI0027BA6A29|nr:M36 family metallopeptidase [Janibacter hoylei]